MSKVIIADSACLIGLSKINKLNILQQLFDEILIPPAVYHEVVVLGSGRKGAIEIKQAVWIKTINIKNQLAAQAFQLNLGKGESEAIVLASELEADFIILDDWRARQTAISLSLNVIGTAGILAKATQKGFITNFEEVIEELRQIGFRLPKNLSS